MKILLAETAENITPTNPIVPEMGEFFWGAVSFGLLYLLIKLVLLPPITKVMAERKETIKSNLDSAATAKAKQGSLGSELDDQLADVKAEAAAILEQARTEAAAERSRLISKAEHEAAALKESTQEAITLERSEAIRTLRPEVVKVSVNAACQVLDRNIDPASAKPILEQKLGNLN